MFIEQIIKFELRGPRLLGRTCNAKTGYFHGKKRSPRKMNLRVNYYLLLNTYIVRGNAPFFPSPGPSQLQNLSKKCYVLKVNFK